MGGRVLIAAVTLAIGAGGHESCCVGSARQGARNRTEALGAVVIGISVLIGVCIEQIALRAHAVRVGRAGRPVDQAARATSAMLYGLPTHSAVDALTGTSPAVLVVTGEVDARSRTVGYARGATKTGGTIAARALRHR